MLSGLLTTTSPGESGGLTMRLAHRQTTSRSGHAILTHRDEWLETHNTELSVLTSRRAISGAEHVVLNHVEQMVDFLRRLHVDLLQSPEFRIHSALVPFEHLHAPALHGYHS